MLKLTLTDGSEPGDVLPGCVSRKGGEWLVTDCRANAIETISRYIWIFLRETLPSTLSR